jgi:hypothetical protein
MNAAALVVVAAGCVILAAPLKGAFFKGRQITSLLLFSDSQSGKRQSMKFSRNHQLIIRPDGYVAAAGGKNHPGAIAEYLNKLIAN